MKFRILIGLVISFFASISSAATSWQLPTGYYTPAKMPMKVVFPRPDSETNSWARQRMAYADGTVQYRIPITIQGGAYPFHYTLTTGPSGMAVGQDLTDTDYGIVTWTPTSAQISTTPYPVTVTVTDQQGNTVNVTWSVKATTSGFLFVDPNAATNGNGTKASPFNSVGPLFVKSFTTGVYPGYIVYFRGGVTTLTGPDNGNVQLGGNNNPAVWLGYPGEKAVIDFNHQSKVLVDNQHDVYIGGLTLENPRNDGVDVNFFYFNQNAAQNRITFFENDFVNILATSSNWSQDSNQAAVYLMNPGKLRQYFSMVGNRIDNYNTAMVDTFAIKYAVIENNAFGTVNGTAQNGGFYFKSDIQNFSVRRNTALDPNISYGDVFIEMQAQIFTNNNIEICYNLFRSLIYNWGSTGANTNPQVYVYRNTILGSVQGLDYMKYTVYLENNVIVNDNNQYGNTSGTNRIVYASNILQNSSTGNLYGTTSDNYVDQNGNLVGTTASPYRGKVGYNITYGVNPLSAPTWQ